MGERAEAIIWLGGRILAALGAVSSLVLIILTLTGVIPPGWTLLSLLATGAGALLTLVGRDTEVRLARLVARPLGWEAGRADRIPPLVVPSYPPELAAVLRKSVVLWGQWRGADARAYVLPNAGSVDQVRLPYALPRMLVVTRSADAALTGGAPADVVTGDPAFDSRWLVWTQDPTFAQELLAPAVREAFMHPLLKHARIGIEQGVVWLYETRSTGRTTQQVADRFVALQAVVDAVPHDVWRRWRVATTDQSPSAPATPVAPAPSIADAATAQLAMPGSTPERPRTRDRNILGRLALLLPFTCFGAPVGLVLGLLALRAVAQGRANNRAQAIAGIVLAIVSMLFAGVMAAASLAA